MAEWSVNQTYANRLLYSRMILFVTFSNHPITREWRNRPLYEIRELRYRSYAVLDASRIPQILWCLRIVTNYSHKFDRDRSKVI